MPRSEFDQATILALAKRSCFHCAICGAATAGPSSESPNAVVNVGVAAHITAASPGGPRFDPTLSHGQRRSIENGIWLCQTHAKAVDDDVREWPVERLRKQKGDHESQIKKTIGVPREWGAEPAPATIRPREFAFIRIGELSPPYREFIGPIIQEKNLMNDSELGILMCGSPLEGEGSEENLPQWTVFVEPSWLRWFIEGQKAQFPLVDEIPGRLIYGRVPAWPDSFLEFLGAIVQTGISFGWSHTPQGYLALGQVARLKE
jgi:hypothetical protein